MGSLCVAPTSDFCLVRTRASLDRCWEIRQMLYDEAAVR